MAAKSKSRLGLVSIVLLGINTMIGTGIFLLPSKPMELVGPSSVLVYILVTLIVSAIALCFAECASFFSRNGAAYLYAKEAFGDFVGFQVGMLKWVVAIIAWAALATGFVMILGELWQPATQEPIRSVLITALVGGLGILNILGVKHVKCINNIVAVTKLAPLLFFIFLGLFYIEYDNFTPFVRTDMEIGSIGEASLIIFFAFSGFETIAVAAEDMDNPRRNIPIAILIVLAISSLIYFLVQMVVVGVLGPALATSITPIADAASRFFGDYGRLFILISTLISSIGINIASSFITPRSAVVLAEDRLIPSFLSQNNSYGTPTAAIVISVILTILAALSGSFMKLAAISVVARLCQYIPTCLAVFVLRKKYGQSGMQFPRTFMVAIPVLGVLFTFWLLSNASIDELIWGAGAIVLCIPIYLFMRHGKRHIAT